MLKKRTELNDVCWNNSVINSHKVFLQYWSWIRWFTVFVHSCLKRFHLRTGHDRWTLWPWAPISIFDPYNGWSIFAGLGSPLVSQWPVDIHPPCMSFRGVTERNDMCGFNNAPPSIPPALQPLWWHLHAYVTQICIIDLMRDGACHS